MKKSMTNEELELMQKQEVLLGAQYTYDNAKTLFESAKQLATSNNFGTANSLMILSIEEAIKAMLLTAYFLGIKIDFDVSPYFRDHKTKHKEAAKIQEFIKRFALLKDVIANGLTKRNTLLNSIFQFSITQIVFSLLAGNEDPDRFKNWYNNANDIKNNGLYVGYRNSAWSLPNQISEEDFKKTQQMAQPFIESLELIKNLKEDDHTLIQDFNDPNSLLSRSQDFLLTDHKELSSHTENNSINDMHLSEYKEVKKK